MERDVFTEARECVPTASGSVLRPGCSDGADRGLGVTGEGSGFQGSSKPLWQLQKRLGTCLREECPLLGSEGEEKVVSSQLVGIIAILFSTVSACFVPREKRP